MGLEYILPYKARKQCENVEDVSVNRFDFRPLIYKYMILPMSEAISVTVAHIATLGRYVMNPAPLRANCGRPTRPEPDDLTLVH